MSSLSTERDQLAILVKQWNENRVELFRLSYPTEDGGERVLTKCVRVSSTATTRAVVEALTEKFLPDLKMLTDDHYSLWEVCKLCCFFLHNCLVSSFFKGGSLKIYGGELVPSRPYVTILVSMKDRADRILIEALEKYGLDCCNPDDFVLVEMSTSTDQRRSLSDLREVEGRIIGPDEIPLIDMASRNGNESETYLAIKKKPTNYRITSTLRDSLIPSEATTTSMILIDPTLLILGPNGVPIQPLQSLQIRPGVTEIGSDRALSKFSAQNICLEGREVRGRHCVITYMDRVVTITPSASDATIEQSYNEVKLQTDYSQLTQSMYATSTAMACSCIQMYTY
uniref:Ras-associating domain-containing protein n=1 Tax=Heterorhabditis bacteriophora TaxID=37862 RepID=A0A1I7XHN8_HETBA